MLVICKPYYKMEDFEYVSTGCFNESWFEDGCKQPEKEIPKTVPHQSSICEICERRFRYPSQLNDHMLIHNQIRNFVCDICGMRFLRDHHLKSHSAKHSLIKQHMCPVCGRRFSLKANMKRHLRIHDGGSAFKCEQCGKIFAHAQTLKMHLNAHIVGKPYSCGICGKSFSRSHTLGAHMTLHDNSKAHVCETCGKSFTLRENLRRHQRDKHGAIIPTLLSRDYAALASPTEICQIFNRTQDNNAVSLGQKASPIKGSTAATAISPPHIVYITVSSCSNKNTGSDRLEENGL